MQYNSMEKSHSEANSSSDSQDIPRILWNAKVYGRIHDTLTWANVVHSWPLNLFIEEPF